jgi:hypothetical protein
MKRRQRFGFFLELALNAGESLALPSYDTTESTVRVEPERVPWAE